MKAQLRNHVAALFLLAPAAITLTALPSAVSAQSATPEVRSLEVTSDQGLRPGSRLRFKLEGSPHARASIRIRGTQAMIPLAETARGVYTGRYIVTRDDRIREGDAIRAIMRRGNRTVTASYNIPAGLDNVAAAPPAPLRIERFQVATLDRIEPGSELRFSLDGVPGARAFVDLPGIADNVALREVRPGHYEGSYTVRRSDNLNPSGPVVATLRMGERTVTSNLSQPLVLGDSRPPGAVRVPIQVLSHANNGQVDGSVTHVRGRTAPYASVNVRVNAVPPVVGQFGVAQQVYAQTIRADADGEFDFSFSSPFPVPGTRYEVSMTASKADVTGEARLVLYQRQG